MIIRRGCAGLAKEALEKVLLGFVRRNKENHTQFHDFLEKVKNLCWHLLHVRATMAPIGNVVTLVVTQTLRQRQGNLFGNDSDSASSSSIDLFNEKLEENSKKTIAQMEISPKKIAEYFEKNRFSRLVSTNT